MTAQTSFELGYVRLADTVTLDVAGEIDIATAPSLANAIELAQRDGHRIVVNLAQVTFLDASTLNVLLRAKREFAGSAISLCVLSGDNVLVGRLFELTGFREAFGRIGALDEEFLRLPTPLLADLVQDP